MSAQTKAFRQFLVVWSGQFLSAVGSGLTAFALGVYVFQTTHSSTSFSLVILFSFLPSFLLLPFGGVLADRFDRTRMMIIGDIGSIIGIMFIWFVIWTGQMELWHIYTGVGISSISTALQTPAYKAAVTDMVSEEQYSQASGLIQLAGSAQYLLSPILAGFLLGFFDIQMVLLIDMLTFLLAVVAVLLVMNKGSKPQPADESRDFFGELSESFRYLLSQKGVFLLVLLMSVVCFYIGLLQSLFSPMMLTLTDSKVLGISLSLAASGMLASSLFIGVKGLGNNKPKILSFSLALAGLFYALMGTFPAVVPIVVFGFLFFATLPFVNTSLEVLIRTNIDNEKQGRVWSMVSAISQVGLLLAFGSAGFLADHFFSPLLAQNGALADTVGQLIGTGAGRGIGFLFMLSGVMVFVLAIVIGRVQKIRELKLGTVEEKA